MICAVCGQRSPSPQSNSIRFCIIINDASLHELAMQGLTDRLEILEKSCFRSTKDTWHRRCKNILQSPINLIFIVNRFRYIDNQLIKYNLVSLDLNITLGSYNITLQADIDHHRLSVYCGQYTTSVYWKHSIATTRKITACDGNQTQGSYITYIILYILFVEWVSNHNTEHRK